MGSILRAWTQNHPKVIVGTCPGHHRQRIGRNRVFEIERPERERSDQREKISKYEILIN